MVEPRHRDVQILGVRLRHGLPGGRKHLLVHRVEALLQDRERVVRLLQDHPVGGGERAHAVFSRHVPPSRLIRVTAVDRLDLLPADASLRDLNHLFRVLAKKRRLARLLGDLGEHDRVVLDCPPGLTETADQVARAADLIVVPVVPSALSERAWGEVDRHLGGRTATLPVHVMVDRRRALHGDALARHPDWPVIPMASAVESAATNRRCLGEIAPRSPAALAFADLWKRIEKRLA